VCGPTVPHCNEFGGGYGGHRVGLAGATVGVHRSSPSGESPGQGATVGGEFGGRYGGRPP
jgi:hypothetical protein